MTGVLIKGAVPSVDSGWMVLPQSLRSGVSTFEEIATAQGSGAGKIAQAPRLGGFGVEALRLSSAEFGRTLNVTAPPGIGRVCNESLIFFSEEAGTSSPLPWELSSKRKRKKRCVR